MAHPTTPEDPGLLWTTDNWQDTIRSDTPEVREAKLYRGEQLGVAAVLLMPDQKDDLINRMVGHEVKSGLYSDENLYVTVMRGAQVVAGQYYSGISEYELAADRHPLTAEINATRYGSSQKGGKLSIVQAIPDGIRSGDLDVNLFDEVVDEGHTVEMLAEYFLAGKRRTGRFGHRREDPSRSVGLRSLLTKELADLSMFDEGNTVIGSTMPNVWISESGLDGQRMRANGVVQKEILRWYRGISIPTTQDKKYEDPMEETMTFLTEQGITEVTMDDIDFIDTSDPHRRSVVAKYFGGFVGRVLDREA